MKIIKKLNIKRIFRSLKSGVLSTNIFFFLIGLYFSSIALAVTLKVISIDHRIPSGVATGECFSSQRTNIDLDHDRTEDPRDVVWSDDGTMVFTINANMNNNTAKGSMGDLDLSMNKVRDPFELKTVKLFLEYTLVMILMALMLIMKIFGHQGMTNTTTKYRGIHIAQGGRIFIF